jgi:hypothetical protein
VETRSGLVVPYDVRPRYSAYRGAVVKKSYAVVWSTGQGVNSGRLEPEDDRFELVGRDHRLSIEFAGLAGVEIARRQSDRLRGLPVLVLRLREGEEVRVASLEGAGVLRDLVDHVEHAGASRPYGAVLGRSVVRGSAPRA